MGLDFGLQDFRVSRIIAAEQQTSDDNIIGKIGMAVAKSNLRKAIVNQLTLKNDPFA